MSDTTAKPLTVPQAAERMTISEKTVYALCSASRLRHYRIGVGRGAIRIPPEAVEEYLAAATRGGVGLAVLPMPMPCVEPIDPGPFKLRKG